jgi:hypothetical protein
LSKRFDTSSEGEAEPGWPLPTTYRTPAGREPRRLNRQGGAGPLGTKYGSVSLGGAMWDIYQGDIGWKVFSFVRRTNTTKATLNLDDFTQALVRRKLLSNDKYVSGIESGTEVFKGTGRLDTRSYSVTVG